jgi:hypothetical protein
VALAPAYVGATEDDIPIAFPKHTVRTQGGHSACRLMRLEAARRARNISQNRQARCLPCVATHGELVLQLRIDDNRHWPVVDEFHLHVRSKLAGLNRPPQIGA